MMTGDDVAENKKINWPKPYFAVIFTAQRSLSGDDIYEITSDRMMHLAQKQDGSIKGGMAHNMRPTRDWTGK